ncbi:hypothetical protein J1614_001419 [Plenodomus biglobosus]|nr:hypothetical protein J1614_001419 [Plenodomus biglobosus]
MDYRPSRHEGPMQPQHLGTPTSDDRAAPQSAGESSGYFQVGQHEAGAGVSMRGTSSIHNPNTVSLPVRQYTPHGRVRRPPTPPRQGNEERSPLYQRNTEFPQYSVLPVPTPNRPLNDYLQSQQTSDYPVPHSTPWNQVNATGLPTRLPSFAELLHDQPPRQARQPLAAPPLGPPVQEWPTHNLVSHHDKPVRAKRKASGSFSIDQELRELQRKQDIYQQKAERKRQKKQDRQRDEAIAAERAASLKAYASSTAEPTATKQQTSRRKPNNVTQELMAPTPAPHLEEPELRSYTGHPSAGYSDARWNQSAYERYIEYTSNSPQSSFYDGGQKSGYVPRPPPLYPSAYQPAVPSVPAPNTNYDLLPQAITEEYSNYKWTITHYTLSPSQNFPYAQSFLDALTSITLPSQPQKYRWFSHTTRGFIAHGTRYSLLVLHNATNPFTWDPAPDSTTTIGVYGRYWYTHEEIHWTTFAPGITDVVATAMTQNLIAVTDTWSWDMPASQRRFHRAYWRAARMLGLGGLLGRRPGLEDRDEDSPEEGPFDDGFELHEADLQSGWDESVTRVEVEEAKVLWMRLLEDTELVPVPEGGWEHVVTGGSEMEEYG